MYSGSSAWISSDERSMNRLTKPSVQTPRGIAASRATRVSRHRVAACSGRAETRAATAIARVRLTRKSNAAVRSPAFARTPGSGSSPKRRVMNLRIDVVS